MTFRVTQYCALAISLFVVSTVPVRAQISLGPNIIPAPPATPFDNDEPSIWLTQFQQPAPVQPRTQREQQSTAEDENFRMTLPKDLFGSVDQTELLPGHRRKLAQSPASDAVFGIESRGRVSNDVGDLLRKAISSHGVTTQDRTPIVSDTRIRGQRAGQVLASGSYWTPVRPDLDTMMNKIDSRLLENVIVVKGPYSPRYGPGFRFVDFELLQTPRYSEYEHFGSTSFDYESNGEQFYGRQSFWGGNQDWGFRVSYGHRTGTDYETGTGSPIPASYKSRDLFVAVGWDPSDHERFEFNYLRLDQTDLEFPGLVYDINDLGTNGYELTYVNTQPLFGDRFDSEVWFNETDFTGDTLNSGKAAQIPGLETILFSPSGFDGFAITSARGTSFGTRLESTFGRPGMTQTSVGVDITHLTQRLNDIEPLLFDPTANNFPIPPSTSTDIGLYWEEIAPITNALTLTAGARFDMIYTDADNEVAGVPIDVRDFFLTDDLQQEYYLWSAFLTAELQMDDNWTGTFGIGHGQRPPTLTEMYAMSSFIGSLQRGLTTLDGDPELDQERLTQIDIGLTGDFETVRVGAHGYYSWIEDFITYDLLAVGGGTGFGATSQSAQFTNTDLAVIAGFEIYGEADVNPWLTAFGTMSYIEGRDLSRDSESRISAASGGGFGRSGIVGLNRESLPGITPLETRIGLRLHDPSPQQNWGLELSTRIVDNQDRFAGSLEEIETPGFTTYDVRFFKRSGQWLFTAGLENFTDKHYREHLDYRSGLGVFRPGINFYTGVEVTY